MRAPLAHADAIVMLSGSATFRERAKKTAELYHQDRSQKILLTNDNLQSGWSSREQRNPYYYERATAELRRLGVPQQNIEVLAPPVSSTYEEALLLQRYAEVHALHSILVVTSAYHSRRALWTFQRVFEGRQTQVGLEPVDADPLSPPPATWWFHLLGWQTVSTEYPKLIYYWLRFRM